MNIFQPLVIASHLLCFGDNSLRRRLKLRRGNISAASTVIYGNAYNIARRCIITVRVSAAKRKKICIIVIKRPVCFRGIVYAQIKIGNVYIPGIVFRALK